MTDATTISKKYTHCRYCENTFGGEHPHRLKTRDHFIPLSKHGLNRLYNIFIVCHLCNLLKGNFLPEEFNYWLRCKIKWKEYPGVAGFTYNEQLLLVVKKNIKGIYDSGEYLPNSHTINRKIKDGAAPKQKSAKEENTVVNLKYLNYNGKDCPCVGFIDRAYSRLGYYGVTQYSNAYYHSGEERYLFKHQLGVLAFSKNDVEKFIKPFFPNKEKKEEPLIKKSLREQYKEALIENLKAEFIANQTPEQFELAKKHGWLIAKALTDKSPNFHIKTTQPPSI